MIQSLISNIDKSNLPKHVAIIMDGNGRWAKQQGYDRTFGHKSAVESVRSAVEVCGDLGIPYLTLFAFSTENWKRPKAEVNFLMKLLASTIKAEIKDLHQKGIKLQVIGEIEKLPSSILKILQKAIDLTKDNQKATLIMALNYGARDELVHAARQLAEDVKNEKIKPEDINTDLFEQKLFTKDIPPVDLMIRTSGEYRISNFLLWQIAYAELYFTNTLWPDFRRDNFLKAIREYTSRERRYGKTGEQIKTE